MVYPPGRVERRVKSAEPGERLETKGLEGFFALAFAPFRASSGCESPSRRQPRQRKARSRPGKTGARRHPHRPRQPPQSRVRVLPNTLYTAGNSRSKARSVPEQDVIQNLLPKVRQGGGEITPRHTRWHCSSVHGVTGPTETHPGSNKDRRNSTERPQKPPEVRFHPSVFSPVGPARVPRHGGRSGGCREGPVRARTAGTAALCDSDEQLFPFLGVFGFIPGRRKPQRPVSAPGQRRDVPASKPAATGNWGDLGTPRRAWDPRDLPCIKGVWAGWVLGGDTSPIPSSVTAGRWGPRPRSTPPLPPKWGTQWGRRGSPMGDDLWVNHPEADPGHPAP